MKQTDDKSNTTKVSTESEHTITSPVEFEMRYFPQQWQRNVERKRDWFEVGAGIARESVEKVGEMRIKKS